MMNDTQNYFLLLSKASFICTEFIESHLGAQTILIEEFDHGSD